MAVHYLDTPSMGLPTAQTVDAITGALADWQAGTARYSSWEEAMERCRGLFAQIVGVGADSVGLLPSIVPAVAAVADSLGQRAGTVVAHRSEFRSLLLPVLATMPEDRIRWVDGDYSAESFVQHIDTETSAVFISSVASHDGARPALEVIRDACRAVDAALVVDATQSLGIVPLGIPAADVDLLAGAGYKGLRGPRGTAYAFARDGVLTRVRTASPYGARDDAVQGGYGPPYLPKGGAQALDQSPAWLSWVGAEGGLRASLESARTDDAQRVLAHTEHFRGELLARGFTPQPTDLPSPIVSFAADASADLRERLAAAGVRVAHRQGRIRAGFHTYNEEADIEALLAVLDAEIRSRPNG
ncbi:aminotransferase class V-fold PLP-dependent enzyme [Ruania zhangjianzhongii]|uniref:aminotransferase class V-fold PLP-dependent enzyme n=1 Tax=Ruania zhangjianzhongii TaxID=2603206 RepID=UPI0011CC2415|nr:aminotransferase class V-fold PLP-dependent enzyme [Ruania zhangjianzhongii]